MSGVRHVFLIVCELILMFLHTLNSNFYALIDILKNTFYLIVFWKFKNDHFLEFILHKMFQLFIFVILVVFNIFFVYSTGKYCIKQNTQWFDNVLIQRVYFHIKKIEKKTGFRYVHYLWRYRNESVFVEPPVYVSAGISTIYLPALPD